MIRHPAKCEYCGGIVSISREKGDASRPIDSDTQSADARFWHTQCAEAEERHYVSARFRSASAEEARDRFEEYSR